MLQENSQVIGPKKEVDKIPEVFSDGREIMDGDFDYDISVLDVDEYSGLNKQTVIGSKEQQ